MRQGTPRWIGLIVLCAVITGCLLNSAHSITEVVPQI
jgi:hypothetical protein